MLAKCLLTVYLLLVFLFKKSAAHKNVFEVLVYLFTSTKSTTKCKYYKHIMQDPGLMDLLWSQ